MHPSWDLFIVLLVHRPDTRERKIAKVKHCLHRTHPGLCHRHDIPSLLDLHLTTGLQIGPYSKVKPCTPLFEENPLHRSRLRDQKLQELPM